MKNVSLEDIINGKSSIPCDGGKTDERDLFNCCVECGNDMDTTGSESMCSSCGITKEKKSDNNVKPINFRIRIVGKGGELFQRDLDKDNPTPHSEMRKKGVINELIAKNKNYKDRGGKPFPEHILQATADKYNEIQRYCVKRGNSKDTILCSLLYHICHNIGDFHRDKSDITDFMELNDKKMSKGDITVKRAINDGKLELQINSDCTQPHIETLFEQISRIEQVSQVHKTVIKKYKDAVSEMIRIMEDTGICSRSLMKSKVAGATFIVFENAGIKEVTMNSICDQTIRPNTVKKVTDEIRNYMSKFEHLFTKA
jgi:hypothetical protein